MASKAVVETRLSTMCVLRVLLRLNTHFAMHAKETNPGKIPAGGKKTWPLTPYYAWSVLCVCGTKYYDCRSPYCDMHHWLSFN